MPLINLNLPDSEISYFSDLLCKEDADHYFKVLKEELQWKQYDIKIFGKTLPQPRLTALYSLTSKPYSYSNLTLLPELYTRELFEISALLTERTGIHFTHCLANLYRNGKDSMGWHSDNEKELGKEPVIASVSLGAVRNFQLRHKNLEHLKYQLDLGHGSLLLMQGKTQEFWKHQLPKTNKIIPGRINLTFRVIK